MQREKVYIVGAGGAASDPIRLRLMVEGFDAFSFEGDDALLAAITTAVPDLVVVVALRGGDAGVGSCMRLRDVSDAPVFVLAEEASDTDCITTLSVGADIVLPHPMNMSLLVAQIHAIFRRRKLSAVGSEAEMRDPDLLVDTSALKVNARTRAVIVDYEPVALTALEFDILALLCGSPGQVFYTSQIFHSVWDTDSILTGDDRTVAVHISNLRKKIERDPMRPRYIVTVRGVGYKFSPPDGDM